MRCEAVSALRCAIADFRFERRARVCGPTCLWRIWVAARSDCAFASIVAADLKWVAAEMCA